MDYVPVGLVAPVRSVESRIGEDDISKRFKTGSHVRIIGSAVHVEYDPSDTSKVAVTASTRVNLISTAGVASEPLSRFKGPCFSGTYRPDAALLAAGTDNGLVKVFHMEHKSQLRTYEATVGRCLVVRFSNSTTLIAGGEDGQVVACRMSEPEPFLRVPDAHTAAVRSIVTIDPLFYTAGDDGHVKLWDLSDTSRPLREWSVPNCEPISSMSLLPGVGGVFLAVAHGPNVSILDTRTANVLLSTCRTHQKNVTSVSCYSATGDGKVFAVGLDGAAVILNTELQAVFHTHLPTPLVAGAIAPDGSSFTVAGVDGSVFIRGRKDITPQSSIASELAGFDAWLASLSERKTREQEALATHLRKADEVYGLVSSKNMKVHDRLLRKLHLGKALEVVVSRNNPLLLAGFCKELIFRSALVQALCSVDETVVVDLLRLVGRYLRYPSFTEILLHVSETIFGVYSAEAAVSHDLSIAFAKLHHTVQRETSARRTMGIVQGQLDCLLSQLRL